MKILFVLDKRVDAGSIHAVANYVRVGAESGHHIAVYGVPDPRYPAVRFSTDPAGFDYVLFIVEAGLQLSGLQLSRLIASVPRSRRVIVDTDGMFNPLTIVDEYDRNHRSDHDRQLWMARHDPIAGTIFQPTLETPTPGAQAVPFFGYDPSLCLRDGDVEKRYQLLYVGHNWWRWREMSTLVLPAIQRVRERVAAVGIVGSWWDAPPPWAAHLALEPAFHVDRECLGRLNVDIRPAVPYTDVVRTMAEGRINVMLQRPLLRRLRLLTAKYFEVFCADTVPLLALDADHAESIYGPSARELVLDGDAAAKLSDVIAHERRYRDVVHAIRSHLATHHSYRCRLEELVEALSGRGAGVEPPSADGQDSLCG